VTLFKLKQNRLKFEAMCFHKFWMKDLEYETGKIKIV